MTTAHAQVEVAWLDARGVITAVNGAWDSFLQANEGDPATCGVGTSYVEACRRAGDTTSIAVADAIERAGSGALLAPVSLLIPCHAPWQRRWFELVVAPRASDSGEPMGCMVVLTPSRGSSVQDRPDQTMHARYEGWLWNVVDEAPDGIVLVGPERAILYANRQAELLTGYDDSGLVGLPVGDLIPDDRRAGHDDLLDAYVREPITRVMGASEALQLRRADGTLVPVEISLAPIHVGTLQLTVATIRDVSVLRAESRARQQLLRTLDLDPDSVFIVDATTGIIEYASHGATVALGYAREQLLGRSLFELTPAASDETRARIVEEHLQFGPEHRHFLEVVRRAADGQLLPFDSRGQLVRTEGEPDRFLVVDRDARPRLEAEAAAGRRAALAAVIARVTRLVLSEAPVNTTFATVVAEAARLVDSENVSLLIRDRTGTFRTAAAVGPAASLHLSGQVELDQDTLRRWAALDEPFQVPEPPEEMPEALRKRAGAGVIVPFPGLPGQRGLIAAFRRRGREPFGASDVETLTELAGQVATAVELGSGRTDRARLNMLEERERIGRDLHDLVIQDVLAVGVQLASLGAPAGPVHADTVDSLLGQLDQVVANLRMVVFEAEAGSREASPTAAVHALCAASSRFLGFAPEVSVGRIDAVPDTVVGHALAVIREGLSNVSRHASAHWVGVRVDTDSAGLVLEIEDDGAGISARTSSGNGVRNMTERARMLGGDCELTPRQPRGSILTWRVPLPADSSS